MRNPNRQEIVYTQIIADTVREPLVILDKALRVVTASSTFYSRFQLTEQKTKGNHIYNIDNGQWNIPELLHLLEIIPKRQIIKDFEVRHRFDTIGEKALLFNASYLAPEDGRAGLILLAIEDITGQSVTERELEEKSITGLKQTEEALRESEERFAAAFQASPDALVVSEVTSGTIIDVNNTWSTHWGFSREQSIGRRSLELGIFSNPDDRRRAVEIMRNEGRLVNFTIELHTKAGELRYALLSTEKLKLRDGQLMLTIIRDETERKRAETALQIERGRLHATLKSIPDEVWITDAKGKIIYINSGVVFDSVGKSDWPDIASALRELELLNPDGTRRAPEDAALSRALRGEITHNVLEMIRHLKTGELRWREVSSSPVRDDSDTIIGAVAIARDITDRKRAEEELQRAKQKLQNTINSITDGFFVLDRNWIYTEFSETGARIIGMRREDLIGKCVWDLFPHAKESKFYEGYHRAVETGQSVHFEEYYPEPLNLWLDVHCYPSEEGLTVYFRDITERKLNEEALQESEASLRQSNQLLESIIEGTPALIAAQDNHHRYIAFNHAYRQAFRQVFGTDVEIGSSMVETLAHLPDDQRKAVELWQQALRGEILNITSEFGDPEHQRRAFEMHFGPIRDAAGKITGAVEIASDVTERKRSEEALRASEVRLRLALDAARMVTWEYDPGTLKVTMSENAEEVLELPRRHKDSDQGYSLIHPNDVESHRALVTGAIATGGSYVSVYRHAHNEFVIWLEEYGKAILDETGKTIRLVGVVQNITARKQAEETLRRRTEELAAANRDLESFSYSVSHDLRNPLRTISGFAEFLREDYSDRLDEQGRDYVHRIDSSVRKMQALIDDMLSLARVGRQEMNREDTDLTAIVRDYLQELKTTEPARQTEFVIQDNLHANADPRMIHLALENLLRNAWKFTSKREVTRIEFGSTVKDNQTVYFVRDNGVGFHMQFAGKIFEPFKRVHAEKEFAGTGVGLSIVQRVIGRHDGKVWAEGETGKGATFYFTIG